jgi:actin-like protein 6A
MSIKSCVKDGIITDWNLLEKIWENSIKNYLKADVKNCPILFAEKPYNSLSSRVK